MSSSDVAPRKRFKDKKHKKGSVGELNPPSNVQRKIVLDETIHVQKDVHVGGNVLSKLVFVTVLLLLGVLLMYMLSQNDVREGSDGANTGVTRWLTDLMSSNYFWSKEKEQTLTEQNDDIEPEEIVEHNYWDFLFPFLSFIQKTYEEPESFEKEVAQEDVKAEEHESEHDDDEKYDDPKMPEDEDDSTEREDEDGEKEEEEELDRESFKKDREDRSFSSHRYHDEDDLIDEYEQADDDKNESSEEESREDTRDENDEENERLDDNDGDDDDQDNEENDHYRAEYDRNAENDDDDDDDSKESSHDPFDEDPKEESEDEPSHEPTNEDQTEPSHVITKLGVGVALIFVAYTVIIRKWNNYDITESAKKMLPLKRESLRDAKASAKRSVDEEHAESISVAENLHVRQSHAPRIDLPRNESEEYSESPSASESEDELQYSADARMLAHEVEDSESYTGTSGSDVNESDIEPSAAFDRYTSGYNKGNITNEYDWRYRDDLDDADEDSDRRKLDIALEKYGKVLQKGEHSVRAKYGIAKVLDQKAELLKSNKILTQAIAAYEDVLKAPNVPDTLLRSVADRVINRMRFKGEYGRTIQIQKLLMQRFPDEVSHQNDLVVTLLMLNRMSEAEMKLEEILRKWPNNGTALVHYGFVLKLKGDLKKAVDFLARGINSEELGTRDGRFYFHLGDALQKLKRDTEAIQVYEKAVKNGLFLSKYQRSLYNVNRLTAKPWWSVEESTYTNFFKTLEANWKAIRNEVLQLLDGGKESSFREEAEQLREVGDWKQLELYSRGVKSQQCDRVPYTCRTVGDFRPAAGCRRGQVKFSIMEPGTHVWPHCGPTNCRLRAHLGLVVPSGVFIRVADGTRTWKEGEVLIFDDSFEHEVWHNGTSRRLILIVDVWHPELTEYERKTLSAI